MSPSSRRLRDAGRAAYSLPMTVQPEAASRPARRVPRAGGKGEARRDSILDAAEQVFSEKGYYGSSMREVSARSGAALGLISHYFASKEELFRAVVERKLPLLSDTIAASVAAAGPGTEAVIRAFIEPFLRIGGDPAAPLHHYVRLTSHFMSSYRVPELTPTLRRLQPVSRLFSDALRSHLSALPEERFWSGVYLIESALIFMTQDSGFLDDLSGSGTTGAAFERRLVDTVRFFAGGLAALAADCH